MSRKASALLAMRRQVLVMQCRLQRLQFRRDLHALADASHPLAWVTRWSATWRSRPLASLVNVLAVAAVAAWHRWMR